MNYLEIPAIKSRLHDGDVIAISTYPNEKWIVHFGYYNYMDNTNYGWYATNIPKKINIPLNEDILMNISIINSKFVNCSPPEGYPLYMFSNCTPYTTLRRSSKGVVFVDFHNLDKSKKYWLHLYTVSRHSGNKYGSWYHPKNYDYDLVNLTNEHKLGYGNIANNLVDIRNPEWVFEDVPDWMPNNGFLQTEWNVDTSKTNIDIDTCIWALPLMKPRYAPKFSFQNKILCGMMGVSNRSTAPLLFKFCLTDNNLVYDCKNILRIGSINFSTINNIDLQPRIDRLYHSII